LKGKDTFLDRQLKTKNGKQRIQVHYLHISDKKLLALVFQPSAKKSE